MRAAIPASVAALLAVLALAAPTWAHAQRETIPRLDGLPLWDGPMPEEARDAWRRAEAMLRDRPSPPPGRTIAAVRRYTSESLAPWLRARREGIAELDRALGELASDPRGRTFATVVHARLVEDVVEVISATPVPDEIGRDPELRRAYQDQLDRTLLSTIEEAAATLETCTRVAAHAPEPMRAWQARCERDRQPLAARARAIHEATPPPAPAPGAVVGADRTPAACTEGAEVPGATPAASDVPAIAVVGAASLELGGADLERVLDAVQRTLARDRTLRLVPRAEVRRAERLARERRESERAPVCARGPTRDEILRATHADLALAEVTARCAGRASDEEGSDCWLEVAFRRPGSDHRAGLPEARGARAAAERGGHPRAAQWVAAARQLRESGPRAGILGALVGPGGGVARRGFWIAAVADDPAPLEVARTLRGARAAIERCFTGRGIVRFDLALTIAPDGSIAAHEVSPDPETAIGAAHDVERMRACVDRAIAATRWRCPPGGAPVTVHATVCTGDP